MVHVKVVEEGTSVRLPERIHKLIIRLEPPCFELFYVRRLRKTEHAVRKLAALLVGTV